MHMERRVLENDYPSGPALYHHDQARMEAVGKLNLSRDILCELATNDVVLCSLGISHEAQSDSKHSRV